MLLKYVSQLNYKLHKKRTVSFLVTAIHTAADSVPCSGYERNNVCFSTRRLLVTLQKQLNFNVQQKLKPQPKPNKKQRHTFESQHYHLLANDFGEIYMNILTIICL